MIIKIQASLKSPLMVGGKTQISNYRESRHDIPGSVLRAAYARAVIQRCPYEHKNYWLRFQGEEECKTCKVRPVCEHFSDLCFPTLYPLGGTPYPITARIEKYGDNRTVGDILKSRLKIRKKTREEANWERIDGIHRDGKKIEIIHTLLTRTAIDYHRRSAQFNSLYTQNAVSEVFFDENCETTDAAFSGVTRLEADQFEAFKHIGILHIGADTTRGLGLCEMSYLQVNDQDTAQKIEERVAQFNKGISKDEWFVVLDLMTDAYLGLEEIGENSASKTAISDEAYRSYMEKKINLPKCYRLERVYKSQEILRGFDTSQKAEKDMRREGKIVIKAGAVFVYAVSKKQFNAEQLLEYEQRGIGKYAEHGFGRIHVCDTFHDKYDVLKGEGKNE